MERQWCIAAATEAVQQDVGRLWFMITFFSGLGVRGWACRSSVAGRWCVTLTWTSALMSFLVTSGQQWNQTRLNHRDSLDSAAQLLFALDQSDCWVGTTGYVIGLLDQIQVISETALLLKVAWELPCYIREVHILYIFIWHSKMLTLLQENTTSNQIWIKGVFAFTTLMKMLNITKT